MVNREFLCLRVGATTTTSDRKNDFEFFAKVNSLQKFIP